DEMFSWYAAARTALRKELRSDGIATSQIRFAASADCRYLGQGYELNVPVPRLTAGRIGDVARDFRALHASLYGHASETEPIEVVTIRMSAFGAIPRAGHAGSTAQVTSASPRALPGRRRMLLPGESAP